MFGFFTSLQHVHMATSSVTCVTLVELCAVGPSNGSPSYVVVAHIHYNAAAGAGEKRMLSPCKSKSTSPVKKKNNLGPSSPCNMSSVCDFNPTCDTGWQFNHTPLASFSLKPSNLPVKSTVTLWLFYHDIDNDVG